MRLTIVGTGYVGLVAGVCFAERGHDVTCIDHDAQRIAELREGRAPFFEPGLTEALTAARDRLHFDTHFRVPTELVFITISTAPTDMHALTPLVRSFPPGCRTVVIKTTVAVGTADQLAREFPALDVVANPEFLREGTALADFRHPERVVIGGSNPRACEQVASLHPHTTVLFMDARSAELSKLAANAMLATRVSFINELARLADATGADTTHVRRVLGTDARIGPHFLEPGIGFGGSCLPKDLRALTPDSPLLAAVELANTRARATLLDKALAHFGGSLHGKRLGVWGLTFKPDTDDTRDSPALAIAHALLDHGATVFAFDPAARPPLDPRLTRVDTPAAAAQAADALFVLTAWPHFTHFDLAHLKSLMKSPVLFDGRNALDAHAARALGFTCYGIGRAPDSAHRRT